VTGIPHANWFVWDGDKQVAALINRSPEQVRAALEAGRQASLQAFGWAPEYAVQFYDFRKKKTRRHLLAKSRQ
jgi:hypothetical protein